MDRDERNPQRVRKGAPADLARQGKNIVNQNQQKLVKKVNVEPPQISRVR